MKFNFKLTLILTFFALLLVTSCQDETIQQTDPNQEETIVPSSSLVNLMRAASSNDGAQDDILDNADCFSIELPVTIIANGITLTIESIDDLEIIEDIFDEFDNDEDDIDYLFPITIILSDYSEIVIEDEEELLAFVEDCIEDDSDEVIECVDFQFPLSFSIYDSEFQVIDTVVVENDEELYDFLEGLEDSDSGAVLASLNYPVTLIYANGETVEVQNNQELEEAIDAAEDDCYDDGDYCEVDDVEMYLMECAWTINNYAGTDELNHLSIYFGQNGTLEIMNGDTTEAISGSWSMSTSNEGFPEIVVSDLTAFEFLEGSWVVVECDDNEFVIEYETPAGEEIQFELEQECEDDLECSAQEIGMMLQQCSWYGVTNLYDTVAAEIFTFNEDGTFTTQANQNVFGTWNIELINGDVYVVLDADYEPHNLIALEWLVVECDDDRLELVSGDNELVFEQECDVVNDDCDATYEDISAFLQECQMLAAVFDENEQLESYYSFFFHENNIFSVFNGNIDNQSGDWVLSEQNNIMLMLGMSQTNILSGDWTLQECNDEQITFVQETDNGIKTLVFEEDCNNDLFGCLEDVLTEVCDEDENPNDGITTVDLTQFYPNCTNDDIVIKYYETEIDATIDVNTIPNPSAYVNQYAPYEFSVFVRAEMAGNTNVFQVFEIEIEVFNCNPNPFDCFEDLTITLCDDEDDNPSDGFMAIDLESVYENCNSDNVVVNYFVTQADADSNMNPIMSPFTNFSNPQVLYVRVESLENNNEFEVFMLQIIIEDCSNESCTEDELDANLVECVWIPVLVDGSTDFSDFELNFDQNQTVSASNNSETWTATWSTSGNPAEGVWLTITQFEGNLQMLNGEWLVTECYDEVLVLEQNGVYMTLERQCI